MGTIHDLISIWDRSGDVSELLSSGIKIPADDEVRAHMSTLPVAEQERVQATIRDIINKLDEYTASMQNELQDLKGQMEQVARTSAASVLYKTAENAGKISGISAPTAKTPKDTTSKGK